MRELVTYVQYGISAPATEAKVGYPILRMNNLQNDGWELSDLKYIELTENEVETYRLRNGDILFNRTNSKELVGKCEVFKEKGDWVFASYLVRVKIDESIALPDFVSIFLNTSSGRVQIDRVSRQIIGMANINAEEIRDLVVPIAPLNQQHALVAEIQTARKTREQLLKKADALLDSIDGYVLAELGVEMPVVEEKKCFAIHANEITGSRIDPHYHQPKFRAINQIIESMGLGVFDLGVLINDISSGITPKVNENYYTDSSGIPFLRVQNVTRQGIDLSDAKFIKREVHEGMLKRSQLRKDDLVFTITGRIGSVAVVPDNFEGNISQHSVRFHLKTQIANININPHYVAVFLNSELGKSLAIREVTGGTRPALDYKALKALKVILPPVEVQNEIVTEVKQRLTKAKELRQEAAKEWKAAKVRFEKQLLSGEVS